MHSYACTLDVIFGMIQCALFWCLRTRAHIEYKTLLFILHSWNVKLIPVVCIMYVACVFGGCGDLMLSQVCVGGGIQGNASYALLVLQQLY